MLPVMETPTFYVEMIGSKERVKFRPFLVREEKLLIMASESEDQSEMLNVMQEIVDVCSFGKLVGKDLPFFELQNIFIKLRSESIGQITEFNLVCGECGHKTAAELDLTTIKPTVTEGHTNKIDFGNGLGVIMRYPTSIDMGGDSVTYDLVVSCIDSVYTTDEVFTTKDIQRKDVEQFVDNLTSSQFKKITEFFLSMPRVEHKIEYDCSNCSTNNVIFLDGVESFFE